MEQTITELKNRFGIGDVDHPRPDEWFITCDKKDAVTAVAWLKVQAGFTHLCFITAVDWIEKGQFQITYMLNNPEKKIQAGIRVFIERSVWPAESEMESIHQLWPAAKTYQRELHEMFGIDFPGSPGVNDPLILEYWDTIPPYRRDFDSKKYAEETYFPRPGRETHDPAEAMKERLYPHEGEKDV